MTSVCDLPATALAALIRDGEVSAREVTEAHLGRIAERNDVANAIVTLAPDALERAAALDARRATGAALGPLHGLPIAHKDLVDTAGLRTTYGSPSYADHVPATDAWLAQTARAAGAVLLGKTNTPEWGAGSHTFNPVFGPTPNPHAPDRSAGGSSGGAASALWHGMVALADGSDLGGSLRNPAAWCGVVGLRPTVGRVPGDAGAVPLLSLAVDGPMARTVADVSLFLSVLADDATLRAPLAVDVAGRRVAWSPTLGGLPVEAAVADALAGVPAALAALGLVVEEATPDLHGADDVFETVRALGFAAGLGELYDADGARMKETVRWNVEQGRRLDPATITRALRLHGEILTRMREFFTRFDYLACPATQVAPFALDEEYPRVVAGEPMGTYLEWMRICSRITTACCPAISVPFSRDDDRLPVGLQLVAAPFAERSLLELGAAVACAASTWSGEASHPKRA